MDKMLILGMAKKELANEVNGLLIENIAEKKENIEKYINFLEALQNLPIREDTEEKNLLESANTEIELLSGEGHNGNEPTSSLKSNEGEGAQTGEVTQSHISSLVSNNEYEEIDEQTAYKFERKLKGGWLSEIGAYVPEAVVRLLGIEHGDYVRAVEKENGEFDYPKHYRYEVAERADAQKVLGREQIDYCLVERDGGLLVVRKSLLDGNRSIRLNEVPHTFIIKDTDIQEYRLVENDIVDIAFFEQNPMNPKVIWKHDLESDLIEENETTVHKKKDKETKLDLSKEEKRSLSGKNILVIGCEPRKTVFKQNIESRGGEFTWASGLEGRSRLTAMIKKADVVLLLIRFIKHQASKDTVEICKEYGVKFGVVDNLGVKSVIDEAKLKISA